MGAESFYITFVNPNVSKIKNENGECEFQESKSLTTKQAIDFIILADKKIKRSSLEKYGKVIINKYLFLTIDERCGYFQAISLEGCLSDFKCNIQLMKETYNQLSRYFDNLHIYDSKTNKEIDADISDFLENRFADKYKIFKSHFPYADFKSLPDNAFYKKYKFRKIKKRIVIIIIFLLLAIFLFGFPFGHQIPFNSFLWRHNFNRYRIYMTDDIIQRIKANHYSSSEIEEWLGDTKNEDPLRSTDEYLEYFLKGEFFTVHILDIELDENGFAVDAYVAVED